MNKRWIIALAITLPLLAALAMYLMGREIICTCGYIKLWHGVVFSSENSQHLFDWYSFTHVVHGLGFYLLLTIIEKFSGKKFSLTSKFLTAVLLESSWEVLENSDFIINRYRAATISLDYFGDSIINSLGDILAMMIGFWVAAKKPLWFSIGLVLFLEIGLLIVIRDNLTINIIMLIYPLDSLKLWQSSGALIH